MAQHGSNIKKHSNTLQLRDHVHFIFCIICYRRQWPQDVKSGYWAWHGINLDKILCLPCSLKVYRGLSTTQWTPDRTNLPDDAPDDRSVPVRQALKGTPVCRSNWKWRSPQLVLDDELDRVVAKPWAQKFMASKGQPCVGCSMFCSFPPSTGYHELNTIVCAALGSKGARSFQKQYMLPIAWGDRSQPRRV